MIDDVMFAPPGDFVHDLAGMTLLLGVRDKLSAVHAAVNQLRAVRRRSQDWSKRARDKPELAHVLEAAQAVVAGRAEGGRVAAEVRRQLAQ